MNVLDFRSVGSHDAAVNRSPQIYAGRAPEDVPAYAFAEAATLAGVPISTLRSWVVGRRFPSGEGQRWSPPVIRLPKGERSFLSFTNLVELHELAAMRRKHALDRQLTSKEMAELRAISTRADITPRRFWNEYEWGDLKADAGKLLARCFDAHLYFANVTAAPTPSVV